MLQQQVVDFYAGRRQDASPDQILLAYKNNSPFGLSGDHRLSGLTRGFGGDAGVGGTLCSVRSIGTRVAADGSCGV